jgi:hypothetical protein
MKGGLLWEQQVMVTVLLSFWCYLSYWLLSDAHATVVEVSVVAAN